MAYNGVTIEMIQGWQRSIRLVIDSFFSWRFKFESYGHKIFAIIIV